MELDLTKSQFSEVHLFLLHSPLFANSYHRKKYTNKLKDSKYPRS